MELRLLGSHGPPISVIGHGGWEAGGAESGASHRTSGSSPAMRAGFDPGITWSTRPRSTATVVRRNSSGGRSRPARGHGLHQGGLGRGTGYHPHSIRRAAEGSLRRLGRDAIDLYQLRWLDEKDVPLEETWGVMGSLVDVGLVRWIGVSNFTAEANRALRAHPARGLSAAAPFHALAGALAAALLLCRQWDRRHRVRAARVRASDRLDHAPNELRRTIGEAAGTACERTGSCSILGGWRPTWRS